MEAEIVARNIMVILSKKDKFQKLTWEEYKTERVTNGKGFTEGEKEYFDLVVDFTVSEQRAKTFSN